MVVVVVYVRLCVRVVVVVQTGVGSASIMGYDVMEEPQQCRRLIGYCPQIDALHDKLTAREHLQLFAAIKVHTHTVHDNNRRSRPPFTRTFTIAFTLA